MINYLKNIFSSTYFKILFLSGAIAAPILLMFTRLFVLNPTGFAKSYAFSEWLINYQGGIVRRGLSGEIFWQLSHPGPAEPLVRAYVILQLAVFGLLLFWIILKSPLNLLKNFKATLLLLLMPGSMISMGLTGRNFCRREMLFLIYLEIIGIAYLYFKSCSHPTRKKILGILFMSLTIGLGVIIPFIYETFVFMVLPATLILLWKFREDWPEASRLTSKFIFIFLTSQVVVFFTCLKITGNMTILQHIWSSINPSDRHYIETFSQTHCGSMILLTDTISLTLIRTIKSMYIYSTFWFWIGVLFMQYMLSMTIFNFLDIDKSKRFFASTIFIVILLGNSPNYAINTDWGRWIVNNTLVVLILSLILGLNWPQNKWLNALDTKIKEWGFIPSLLNGLDHYKRGFFYFFIFFSLTFSIPHLVALVDTVSWNPFASFLRFVSATPATENSQAANPQ